MIREILNKFLPNLLYKLKPVYIYKLQIVILIIYFKEFLEMNLFIN